MKNKILLLTAFFVAGLTASLKCQVIPNYLPANGLAGWWSFNGDADDGSGNMNHGNVHGATQTDNQTGTSNSAYYFNGIDNNITAPSSASLTITDSISVGVWVRPGQSPGNSPEVLMRKGGTATPAWSMNHQPGNNFLFWIHNGSWNNSGSSITNPDSALWYFVVGTYDGSMASLYVNGMLENSSAHPGNISQTNDSLYFGSDPHNGGIDWLEGKLSDCFVYNRKLSDSEIQAIYQGGLNSGITQSTNASALTIYPNPVKSQLHIRHSKITMVRIMNAFGVTVSNYSFAVPGVNKADLDVSTLPKGIYFIKIGTQVKKIVLV